MRKQKSKFIDEINQKISLKILAWIVLILSALGILNYILIFFQINFLHLGIIVSSLGIASSICIFKGKKIGVTLALIWSVLQIFILQIGSFSLNLSQFLKIGFNFQIVSEPFISVEINFLAIILFFLAFVKLKGYSKRK